MWGETAASKACSCWLGIWDVATGALRSDIGYTEGRRLGYGCRRGLSLKAGDCADGYKIAEEGGCVAS